MSLLRAVFTMPNFCAYTLKAAKEVWYRADPNENHPGACSERVCDGEQEAKAQAMQDFLGRVGVRRDVVFSEKGGVLSSQAKGTNIFTGGDAAVLEPPGFSDVDAEARQWTVKHEISHIKHSDVFAWSSLGAATHLVLGVFAMYSSLPFVPAVFLANLGGSAVASLFLIWREAKADDFAIEHGTDEELKGGRRFLMVARQLNVIERTLSPFNNIRFSSEGEDRVDLAHPSFASRIRKIEQALSARGIDLRTLASQEEEDKIKKLGEFFFEEKYFKNLGDNCEPVPEL